MVPDMGKRKHFATGQPIPDSGIYAVRHLNHRLPHEVTLLKGEQFPRCGKCSDRVRFELLRVAPDIYSHSEFQIRLYELPELEETQPEEQPDSRRKIV